MQNNEKMACMPHLGDYSLPVCMLIERCLGYKTMVAPTTTKKTVEIGSKNSPDTVCTPFKITLGNYIEALEKGANVLIAPSVGCRLGFYDVLQKQILTDLGYEFEIVNLFEHAANATRIYRALTVINPDLKQEDFDQALGLSARIVVDIDELANFMRRNMAFELVKGKFEEEYSNYLRDVKNVKDKTEAEALGNKYKEIFRNIKIDKPERPMRIGIIGDLYTVIEPHGNCHIEKWLAANKIEIIRAVDLTYLTKTLFDIEGCIAKSGGYVKYSLGGNANNTIALAYELAKEGIDGLIHMKAATCSPEITAMTILQNIAKEFNVPIIYFTFDTETSETGLHTRLEAFNDMLIMKGAKA